MTVQQVNVDHLRFDGVSQAVRSGDVIAVSGQVAISEDGSIVDPTDHLGQARRCFANLGLVLEAAGSGLRDVLRLNAYLTSADMYTAYATAKREALGDCSPAGTVVVVAALLDPRFVLEVEAIARVDGA